MNVVDSSGWIEYLSGGPNAPFFSDPIEDEEALLVPALSLFEVYRHLIRHLGRDDALTVIAAMRQGTVIDLDDRLALDAAELSVRTKLALADSIMLATARAHDAVLWTQDADFEGHENVRLRRKS
ncbi:MAG: type II toxin-antitoxin system VapC family toxin [Gemmatimonadales bacterium]|nr:MAG: type II toxin-antitoxin system VapC family toxin [Gemmatimonadales bacterium]